MDVRGCALGLSATLVLAAAPAALGADTAPTPAEAVLVCDEYAGDPEPGTDAWQERDGNNLACATQRQQDNAQNPAFLAKWAEENVQSGADNYPRIATELVTEPNRPRVNPIYPSPSAKVGDPFRMPDDWAAAGRGRMERLRFVSSTGAHLVARVYAPNEDGHYPGIMFSPGLQSYNEVNSWFAQGLAEAGYVVLIIDPQSQGDSENCGHAADGTIQSCSGQDDIVSSINFLLSSPTSPHPRSDEPNAEGTAPYNPYWELVDRSVGVGIAGHSNGAIRVTPVAQSDPRVDAVVAYDNLDGLLPANGPRRTPALYFYVDYAFPLSLTPRRSAPNARQHMGIFDQLSTADVDVMSITTRASTHYEWGYQPFPASFPASRYGERVSLHYTLAWFDKYLKQDPTATDRLVRRHFDDSADRSSIGAGTFDPATASNVPYRIAGKCAANLLSFYYASAYRLDGGALTSNDMRSRGCGPDPDPEPDPPLAVAIDVQPDEPGPTRLNPRAQGTVPVAVLSGGGFDARTVDPASLRFGRTGEEDSLATAGGRPRCEVVDVDADGALDLRCHFDRTRLGYTGDEGHTTAVLTGWTSAAPSRAIRGEDRVEVR